MPIYEFICEACGMELAGYRSLASERHAEAAHDGCGGSLRYAGLSAPIVGRAYTPGVTDASGAFIPAMLRKTAPQKKRLGVTTTRF